MREEDERKEIGEKKIEEETVKQISSAKEYIKNSLDSISITELKRLADDDDYSDDTLMTSNAYLTMCKKKDHIEDETLRLATENIKFAEQLESDSQNYTENVNPLFEEQRDRAAQMLEQIEAKQGELSRENAIRFLKTKANDKYKESKTLQSNFCKNGTISKDEFLTDFLTSRTEYYRLHQYM